MGVWGHIILEGYCMYSSASQKVWNTIGVDNNKRDKIKNEGYIPKSKRPNWCKSSNKKRLPQFNCLCYGKKDEQCPFFGMTEATKGDIKLFQKAYCKKYKEDKNGT